MLCHVVNDLFFDIKGFKRSMVDDLSEVWSVEIWLYLMIQFDVMTIWYDMAMAHGRYDMIMIWIWIWVDMMIWSWFNDLCFYPKYGVNDMNLNLNRDDSLTSCTWNILDLIFFLNWFVSGHGIHASVNGPMANAAIHISVPHIISFISLIYVYNNYDYNYNNDYNL